MHNQFLIDKQLNLPIEDVVAPEKIRQWYAAQGFRINRIVKNDAEDNTPEQAAWDLIDTFGKKWEVKRDRLFLKTGNFFLEHQAIGHSQADYFLLLTFRGHILTAEQIRSLMHDPRFKVVSGGDYHRSIGTLVPVSVLEEITPPV